ncbi:MAG: hypothetical protein S4CHLAM45_14290 [Chlamydiales bacterium]|nr:hypothetical protein [Chlamydiales bacterium]MCH9620062.1 hypothetical protein [Chlamydiales bacterium]MCH9623519.1 hypothetical protein [Chlamydiales bacterium]
MSHRPQYTNRLIHEKSPYLLQHAHNPIDWYPWGEEAFNAAREQDKPIFLSIGYATCHWCHVMDQESFSNVELAQMMNETFININVDREEMPEVDSLYMEFAQAIMSGGAGWPLNLILTPELEPFFAATYLPSDAMHGFLGMKQLIMRVRQIWEDREERENVASQASKIVDVFAEQIEEPSSVLPGPQEIQKASELLFKTADPIYGGTKGAPKFPIGFQACFLLRQSISSSDSRSLFYVEKTLDMMYRGGIYDHVGGGFSRYCIDEQWMIPHFEKMLYDNAILSRVYLEAWEYTKQPNYREVSEQLFNYLVREMQGEEGGFYSAEDADSDGDEGKFYSWTWEEIHQVLADKAPLFCEYYGVTPAGNFKGNNILHMPFSIREFSDFRRIEPSELLNEMKGLKEQLWNVREKRNRPLKDDKILTAWNGLAIHAFVEGGRALLNPTYLEVAEKAARFIRKNLWEEGTLKRRWRDGEAKHEGILDDYAFMIHGLLSLFEADCGVNWLEFALELSQVLDTDFLSDQGAYYLTNGKDPNLLLRRCEFYDGAEPSGNALHAENLLRLYQITGIREYRARAEKLFLAAKEHIDLYPPGTCYHLMALQRMLDVKAPTITISLNEKEEYKDEISKMIAAHYLPHKVVIWRRESDEVLRDLVPPSRVMQPIEGKTTLYICYQDHCLEPIIELPKMWEAFDKL